MEGRVRREARGCQRAHAVLPRVSESGHRRAPAAWALGRTSVIFMVFYALGRGYRLLRMDQAVTPHAMDTPLRVPWWRRRHWVQLAAAAAVLATGVTTVRSEERRV